MLSGRATLLRCSTQHQVWKRGCTRERCLRLDKQLSNHGGVPLFSLAKAPRPVCKYPRNEARFSAVSLGPTVEGTAKDTTRYRQLTSPGIHHLLRSFHEIMVCDRRPLQFLGLRTRTNLSNVCGHASFVTLALAYLETDVLMLRGYVLSGIGLSILFQFYRAQPLWIPIGWNGLFMAINISMIALLLKEQNDASKIQEDPEQMGIFQEVFVPVGLSPVDFVRLADLAERRVIRKGELLSQAGVTQGDVYLIVEGTAEVESDGKPVGHLYPKQFVGTMAFQDFITWHATPTPSQRKPLDAAATPRLEALTAPRGGATFLPRPYPDTTTNRDALPTERSAVLEEAKKAGEAALMLLGQDSLVGVVAKSLIPETQLVAARGAGSGPGGSEGASPLEPSRSTVTATADMVVYAWDMHLLKKYIRGHPSAGLAVQIAMSADLTRKVDQSRGYPERYRLWLSEALAGGEITPIEKKKLRRFRQEHGISLAEHQELLEQNDWTEEEFEAGFQRGVAPRDGSKDLLKYEALVQRELGKGEVVDEVRQHLREFRRRTGIDAQEHLLVLNKQGWTADDYEVGRKGMAAAAGKKLASKEVQDT